MSVIVHSVHNNIATPCCLFGCLCIVPCFVQGLRPARALLSCVSCVCTALSKHAVGVEPLFCLVFWDRGHEHTRTKLS